MNKDAYVYFMSNQHNTTLYVGVTNDLLRRTAEHKAHVNKGFTDKYNCDKLVYFEEIGSIGLAIEREKVLKKWKRKWKNDLVNEINPEWKDLSESIGLTEEYIDYIKEYYKQLREE
jgi:putative endonuclease